MSPENEFPGIRVQKTGSNTEKSESIQLFSASLAVLKEMFLVALV